MSSPLNIEGYKGRYCALFKQLGYMDTFVDQRKGLCAGYPIRATK
jgi:hypothetical protein